MKSLKNDNFLEKVPRLNDEIEYKTDEDGKITLTVKNKGFFNYLSQKLFFSPEKSYIHLDELGSYCIGCTDGKKNIIEIGEMVKEKFGDDAQPLYERLSKFYQIMDSYKFILWN